MALIPQMAQISSGRLTESICVISEISEICVRFWKMR